MKKTVDFLMKAGVKAAQSALESENKVPDKSTIFFGKPAAEPKFTKEDLEQVKAALAHKNA